MARQNPNRRRKTWAEKHGTPDPLFALCPALDCQATSGEPCRAIPGAFHPERIAQALYGGATLRQIGSKLGGHR